MFWNKNFKLLSISGGSQKGFVSLIIALELERKLKEINPNKEFIEYFDSVVAVSSGSIIASCLVLPSEKNPKKPKYSLSECYEIFNQGSTIVNENLTHWNKFLLFAGIKNSMFSAGAFIKKLYNKDVVDQNLLENCKLSQTVIPINIISYDIDGDKPRIWSSYEAQKNPKEDFYLKDAFLASAALPPIFPKKTTLIEYGENLNDYDGGIIHPSPLMASLPYIAEIKNLQTKDFYIISIGTTISKNRDTLKNLDNQYILRKAIDFFEICQQIIKPAFDDFLKHFYKEFYKLDLKVPSKIQQSLYNKNKSQDIDNYNKMIVCTLKYIDENEELFTALANKIADKKQDMKKLEKLYNDSDFYCENPEELLAEYNEQLDIRSDL